jgi:hypothetical protein
MLRSILLSATLLALACGSDDGEADTDTDGSSSGMPTTAPPPMTTGPSDDSSSGEAPCEGTCIDLPDFWSGPVTLLQAAAGEDIPECGGTYASEFFSLGVDLLPPTGTCECACTDPRDVTCGQASVTVHGEAPGDCSDLRADTLMPAAGCNDAVPPLAAGAYTLVPAPAIGTCEATTTPMLDPPAYEQQLRVCGVMGLSNCGAGLCAPEPPADFGRICVFSQGDVGCPGGGFDERFFGLDLVLDMRTCEPDACGCAVDPADCDTTASFTDDCVGAPDQTPIDGCTALPPAATAINLQATPAVDAGCAPVAEQVDPGGAVVVQTAFTFCCQS